MYVRSTRGWPSEESDPTAVRSVKLIEPMVRLTTVRACDIKYCLNKSLSTANSTVLTTHHPELPSRPYPRPFRGAPLLGALEDALHSVDLGVVLVNWVPGRDVDTTGAPPAAAATGLAHVLWGGATDPAVLPVWSTNLLGSTTPDGCIPDGPIANLQAPQPSPHCVHRGFTARTAGGMPGVQF